MALRLLGSISTKQPQTSEIHNANLKFSFIYDLYQIRITLPLSASCNFIRIFLWMILELKLFILDNKSFVCR